MRYLDTSSCFWSPHCDFVQAHSVATIHRPQRPASNGAHAFEDTKAVGGWSESLRQNMSWSCHMLSWNAHVPGAIMCHSTCDIVYKWKRTNLPKERALPLRTKISKIIFVYLCCCPFDAVSISVQILVLHLFSHDWWNEIRNTWMVQTHPKTDKLIKLLYSTVAKPGLGTFRQCRRQRSEWSGRRDLWIWFSRGCSPRQLICGFPPGQNGALPGIWA